MPAIIVDPELLAAVTRQFQLRGSLQPFNLTENVVPVFDIGRLTGIIQIQKVATPDSGDAVRVGVATANHLSVGDPPYDDSDIFQVEASNPTAATVLADTGQLTSGIHRISARYAQDSTTTTNILFEWRNAANSATLALWRAFPDHDWLFDPIFVSVLTNERFRFVQNANITASVDTTIGAVRSVNSVA